MKNPDFWYDGSSSFFETLLTPLTYLWKLGGKLRFLGKEPYKGKLPIIVIGNVTTGGTGKTPTAIYIAKLLLELGKKPAFVSRGYGGTIKEACLITNDLSYKKTGDEPQILNYHAPVIVARNRVEGIRLVEEKGFDVAILDDGLQNHPCFYKAPTKFLNILVCDANRGFGNGKIMPAGPLREEVSDVLDKVEVVFMIGDTLKTPPDILLHSGKKLISASKKPLLHGQDYKGQKIIAFAGLGNPEQFFQMLEKQGSILIEKHIFPDHYPYSEAIIQRLINDAERQGALLVTTEKDMIRIDTKYYPYITPFLIELFVEDIDKKYLKDIFKEFFA